MSSRLKRSTEIQTDPEAVSGASESLDVPDSPRGTISPKRPKRGSSKRLPKSDSLSSKSTTEAGSQSVALGEVGSADGVLSNARRTVAHISFGASDLKSSSEISPTLSAGSRSANPLKASADPTGTSPPAKRRNLLPVETSYSSDGEYTKKSLSPKRAESMTLRSPRTKTRSTSASVRMNRLSGNFDRAVSSSSTSPKKKTRKSNQVADNPSAVSIEQARSRLAISDGRPVFLKSSSFHCLSPIRKTLGFPKEENRTRLSSVDSPTDPMSSVDPFLLLGVRKRLLRTRSVPYMYSWEVGNLEIDLWLPTVGYVYDHLQRQWRRKKKKKKSASNDTEDSSLAEDSVLAVPLSARSSKEAIMDSVESMVLQDDGDEKLVMAGTLRRLLTLLADQNVSDKDYIDIFLSTHLHFISSEDLLSFLVEHFANPTDSDDAGVKTLIQVRVVNVMKKWIRYHPYEFEGKPTEASLHSFIRRLEALGQKEAQLAAILKDSWSKRDVKNAEAFEFDEEPPKPLFPKRRDDSALAFFDCEPTEIARQLTLIHYDMFAQVRNPHLILATKEDKDPENPVNIISNFSDRITRWCITEIVSADSVKRRAQVLQNMIKLCHKLVDLRNFHGAMDIFLAVGHFLVARLKRTWKALDRGASASWKNLSDLFNPSGGWRNLRKTIHQATPPLVIPPAIWLHDLLSIAENDPYWDDGKKLINFEKMRLFSTVFKNVYRCQVEPYNYSKIDSISSFLLTSAPALSSGDLESTVDSLSIQESKKPVNRGSISLSSASNSGASSSSSGESSDKPGQLKRRSSLADFLGRFKISK